MGSTEKLSYVLCTVERCSSNLTQHPSKPNQVIISRQWCPGLGASIWYKGSLETIETSKQSIQKTFLGFSFRVVSPKQHFQLTKARAKKRKDLENLFQSSKTPISLLFQLAPDKIWKYFQITRNCFHDLLRLCCRNGCMLRASQVPAEWKITK